jgi:Histidine kinase-, DNA gyrase B-, and HSP90-like ATPase
VHRGEQRKATGFSAHALAERFIGYCRQRGTDWNVCKELFDLHPDALLAHSTPVLRALSRETRKIPIVFAGVSDPIGKNAIEAMAVGPTTIRTLRPVTTQDGNSVVSLSVPDSGPGISPENTHVFDPFFTTKSSETGLELARL